MAKSGKIDVDTNQFDLGIPEVAANSSTLAGVLNGVYFWAGIIAVLIIVIAGFFFVTANGDANQIARAKKAILGAVIGLVIVLSAYIITGLVLRVA